MILQQQHGIEAEFAELRKNIGRKLDSVTLADYRHWSDSVKRVPPVYTGKKK